MLRMASPDEAEPINVSFRSRGWMRTERQKLSNRYYPCGCTALQGVLRDLTIFDRNSARADKIV
jgi:hypothetical protein